MFNDVCDESNAWPIEGSATLATARLRLATAAPRISAERTNAARLGTADSLITVARHPRTVGRARVRRHHSLRVMGTARARACPPRAAMAGLLPSRTPALRRSRVELARPHPEQRMFSTEERRIIPTRRAALRPASRHIHATSRVAG